MSISPVSSITRAACRKPNDKLNILCATTHARYETGLAKTGHNFYAFQHESFVKGWNKKQAIQPDNYQVFDIDLGNAQIPGYLDFDLVLSQNKFGQFQVLSQIAQQFGLPLISLEHTLPVPNWPKLTLEQCKLMRGNINVFISDYSIRQWGWEPRNDTCVIRHCVDTHLFHSLPLVRNNHILTVANDYIGRDWCLNFQQYQRVTKGLPVFPVGDTKGLSKPAESTEQLVEFYQGSRIFLNTAHISPIPTSLLEAMACGCACVSIKASEIPYYITHGVDGFLANNDEEMRAYLELLLKDAELAQQMGEAAVATIAHKCSEERFINEWNQIFTIASKIVYKG